MRHRSTLVIAVCTALTVLSGPVAGAAPPPPEPAAVTPKLGDGHHSWLDEVQRFEKLSGKINPHGITDVLADPNHRTRGAKSCNVGEWQGVDQVKGGFCWTNADNTRSKWIPQGLTASWDGLADGKVGEHTVMLASWYAKSGRKTTETRVTVVDMGKNVDNGKGTYRHVALVKPVDKSGKNPEVEPVISHVGGIAWVGRYLYVAETNGGLRVFDLKHFWRADTKAKDYGISDGKVRAGGAKWALPQVGYYKATGNPGACSGSDQPVYSSVAVDRTSKNLVTGEFCWGKGDGRVVRWPLDLDSGLLKDSGGDVTASDWYWAPNSKMQGVVTHGNTVYTTQSDGRRVGRLNVYEIDGKSGSRLRKYSCYTMPRSGPEDLTYRPGNGELKGHTWTLTEYPLRPDHEKRYDMRYVFPLDHRNLEPADPC